MMMMIIITMACSDTIDVMSVKICTNQNAAFYDKAIALIFSEFACNKIKRYFIDYNYVIMFF